ncbi:hypothetical protein [Bacillus sp. EB01]|uniref:hypothetical protein n=1 Tax=Bacillus sp. EB01 TaxID=1347086 RepID=UPI0005C57B01|nr:hypothetical protein [Bacillus sp. EB01]
MTTGKAEAPYGLLEKAITFSSCDADAAEAFLVEGLEGDKGNTMSSSESMLTYRNEGTEVHYALGAPHYAIA